MEKFYLNPWFDPSLSLIQPKSGYRFSSDPFILSALVNLEGVKTVLDVGCGCGIIPLLLSNKSSQPINITGVELQRELVDCALQNIANHHLAEQVRIIHADINQIRCKDINGPVDLIVSNPPYKKSGTGRINPDPQKAVARHEIKLTLNQLFAVADRLLTPSGNLTLIFPYDRLEELHRVIQQHHFFLHAVFRIHTTSVSEPKRVVICASKQNPGRNATQTNVILSPAHPGSEKT